MLEALLVLNLGASIALLWTLYQNNERRISDQTVTFNQLCTANQRLGAIVAMLGHKLDDIDRFAKESVIPKQAQEEDKK